LSNDSQKRNERVKRLLDGDILKALRPPEFEDAVREGTLVGFPQGAKVACPTCGELGSLSNFPAGTAFGYKDGVWFSPLDEKWMCWKCWRKE